MATATKKAKKGSKKKATAKTTRLHVLIDESGSMASRTAGVIEGYNEFMDAMKAEKGELLVSLSMFDSRQGDWVREKFIDVPIAEVGPLGDYYPHGGTPLNDALFDTLESLGARLGEDEQAIVVVMTDGAENQSRRHTAADVKDIINAREQDGWVFIYLGAAHDVWAQSGGLGFQAQSAKTFSGSASGTATSLRSAAMLTNTARAGGQSAYYAATSATPDVLPDGYLEGQALTSEAAAKLVADAQKDPRAIQEIAKQKLTEAQKSEVESAVEKAKGATK